MILFVRRIPASTLPSELYDFINPALKSGLFIRTGRILGAGILVLEDKYNQMLEFHGYVVVDFDQAGLRAIRRLKGKQFKGRSVIVREYKYRNLQNDRRLNNDKTQRVVERRTKDRRRGNVIEVTKNLKLLEVIAAPV